MVLLDIFQRLKSEWNLGIAIAHVNHQLRGEESTEDEEFVREAAERCQVSFFCKRVDTVGLKHALGVSKQEAAREARYQFFEELMRQTSSDHVATAHHADDNAETVLLNALRGGGVRGLAGIPRVRASGHFVRPLLFARRTELLSYAREEGIRFRNDSSNESLAYARNYLRHKVVPILDEDLGMDISDSLNRLSDAMKRFSHVLEILVDEQWGQIVRSRGKECQIFLPAFTEAPLFLQEEIVLRLFREMEIEPSTIKISEILRLCTAQTGHSLNPSGGVIAYRDRDYLIFSKSAEPKEFSINVSVGTKYSLENFTLTLDHPGPVPTSYSGAGFTEYVDADTIKEPLKLRNWKHGDWFIPIGMKGRKKLSDFFSDAKISFPDKIKIPLLQSGDDIVWVCGRRLDDRFKITNSTRHAIKLSYSPAINSAN